MVSIMENQALKLTFKEKRFLGICKLNKLNSFVEYNVVFSIWLCNVSGNIWVLLYQKSFSLALVVFVNLVYCLRS